MSWPLVDLSTAVESAEVFVDGDWVESKDQDPGGDVRLIQLADIGDGVYLNKSSRFMTAAKARDLKCTFLKEGDVLVARMPDPLGRACIFPGDAKPAVTAVDVCIIRPRGETHEARWLMHALNMPGCRQQIAGFATGTTRSRISRSNLGKVKIPDLPLEDQRRIAEVLDRANALQAKRRATLAQLDTITQSIFLSLFGDVGKHQWPMTTITGIAHPSDGSIRTGPFGSQLLHSEFVDEGVAVLGIDNAVTNEFRWDELRFISYAKYQELKRYTVRPGDVLITIMGTCGRCAVVPDDVPLAINTKHLCCITLDQDKCLPVFVHAYFLRHPRARRYLDRTAKGAIMSGLNMGIVKEMPIPLPPIELQREFATCVAGIEKLTIASRTSLGELDALFGTLQHRAFRGEL